MFTIHSQSGGARSKTASEVAMAKARARSAKRNSPKRKSSKRNSPKRKSPKRKSPKRKSSKRNSPKRKSPKRNSPKRKSPSRSRSPRTRGISRTECKSRCKVLPSVTRSQRRQKNNCYVNCKK